jgi:hypothetical protein
LVTAIELLSPANKTAGPMWDAYLSKREDYFTAGVNLIEMDFLRAGKRMPLGKRKMPGFDYYMLSCSAVEMPRAGFWPLTVRDPLPRLTVPLDPGEEVEFHIRDCLDRAYDEARYSREIDYTKPPVPPLRKTDASWARALLSKKLR